MFVLYNCIIQNIVLYKVLYYTKYCIIQSNCIIHCICFIHLNCIIHMYNTKFKHILKSRQNYLSIEPQSLVLREHRFLH